MAKISCFIIYTVYSVRLHQLTPHSRRHIIVVTNFTGIINTDICYPVLIVSWLIFEPVNSYYYSLNICNGTELSFIIPFLDLIQYSLLC